MTTTPVAGAPTGIIDHKPDPKIAGAASQFEALLLGEMLKSANKSGSGDWMGDADGESGTSLAEMAQEQFAQALAKSGGLGFARMVTDQLTPNARFRVGKVDAP
jgi:Rod binding domain-containing protein